MAAGTEPATRRQLARARAQAFVPTSPAAVWTAAALAGGAALWSTRGRLVAGFEHALATAVRAAGTPGTPVTTPALASAIDDLARALAPTLGGATLGATLVGVVTTGFLFAPGAARPRFGRLAPGAALARFGRARTYVEPAAQLAVGTGVVALGAHALWTALPAVLRSPRLGAPALARVGVALGRELLGPLAAAAILVALGDLLYRRGLHARDLRMTPADVRRERRDDEGDPGARRAREDARAQDAALEHRARFVVLDPGRAAVALAWDAVVTTVPVPVARATGAAAVAWFVARAARAGVAIVSDPALAQALADVALDRPVPAGLYDPLATVVAALAPA